jgi:hypothetical protein
MATTTLSCNAYVGTLEDIPNDGSPGLLFLKKYLSLQDSLDDSISGLKYILAPTAVIINNAAAPVHPRFDMAKVDSAAATQGKAKLEKRTSALQALNRELRRVWDINNGNGRRTVVWESYNYYVFRADPENPVFMPESGIIELESVHLPEGENSKEVFGVEGVWATELRSWHDRVGLLKKREELAC